MKRLALVWHIHQPFFVPDEEVLEQLADSYRPLLSVHREHGVPLTLNVTGALLERLERLAPDFVGELDDGLVEVVASGMFHPLLPLLPSERAAAQLDADIATKARLLKRCPAGFWPTDLAFAHSLVPELAARGIRWVIVDGAAKVASATLPGWQRVERQGQPVLEPRQRPLIHEREWASIDRAVLDDSSLFVAYRHPRLSADLVDLELGALSNVEGIPGFADQVEAYFESGAPRLLLGEDGERIASSTLPAYRALLRELDERGIEMSLASALVDEGASSAREIYLPASTFLVDFSAWQSTPDDQVCWRLLGEVQGKLAEIRRLARVQGDAAAAQTLDEIGRELLPLEDAGFVFWKYLRRTREPFLSGLRRLDGRLDQVVASLAPR
jgi:predicted glycosyl hydrolase (DUF1957 family)